MAVMSNHRSKLLAFALYIAHLLFRSGTVTFDMPSLPSVTQTMWESKSQQRVDFYDVGTNGVGPAGDYVGTNGVVARCTVPNYLLF